MSAEPKPEPPPPRDLVLLPLEARARGFKSPVAFKRWCWRHKVPILTDVKLLWVRPADVDAALARIAKREPAPTDLNALAAQRVAQSLAGGA
jgi:hypothetical protein